MQSTLLQLLHESQLEFVFIIPFSPVQMKGGNLRIVSLEVGEVKVVRKRLLFAGESASNKK